MTHATLRFAYVVLAALLTLTLLPGAAQAQETSSSAHVIDVDTLGRLAAGIAF